MTPPEAMAVVSEQPLVVSETGERVPCQECGYDLRGVTPPVCPECGCPAKLATAGGDSFSRYRPLALCALISGIVVSAVALATSGLQFVLMPVPSELFTSLALRTAIGAIGETAKIVLLSRSLVSFVRDQRMFGPVAGFGNVFAALCAYVLVTAAELLAGLVVGLMGWLLS